MSACRVDIKTCPRYPPCPHGPPPPYTHLPSSSARAFTAPPLLERRARGTRLSTRAAAGQGGHGPMYAGWTRRTCSREGGDLQALHYEGRGGLMVPRSLSARAPLRTLLQALDHTQHACSRVMQNDQAPAPRPLAPHPSPPTSKAPALESWRRRRRCSAVRAGHIPRNQLRQGTAVTARSTCDAGSALAAGRQG